MTFQFTSAQEKENFQYLPSNLNDVFLNLQESETTMVVFLTPKNFLILSSPKSGRYKTLVEDSSNYLIGYYDELVKLSYLVKDIGETKREILSCFE